MRNLKVILSYDGAEFSGWQVQPDAVTVQGTLASAIGRITGEKVLPQGSGRTDAGVHALAQVMTFVTESSVPTRNFLKALNDILPASVRVLEVTEEPPGFHARHSARSKTYRYRIYRETICPPFLARYVWHYPYPLAEEAMARAAAEVVGEHDFTSFAAVDPERRVAEGTASDECPKYFFVFLGKSGGRARVHGARLWVSAPHGQKSRGYVHSRGQGNIAGSGCVAHSGGARPLGCGFDRAGEGVISGRSGILGRFT